MLQIYDSLSRGKRPFVPVQSGQVSMYVCGMTVYDFCHLGHARMLVSFDVIARWLRVAGFKVTYVRNITDIDDKIIKRAVQTNQKISDVTRFFIQAMHADEAALGVQAPDHQPQATEHVSGMLDIIDRLESRGHAYRAPDGDVNYAVRSFEGYGKLSGKTLDELRAGERVAVTAGKRDPLDFVLWKAAKATEPPESKWQSPYGWGRPGWHIECSAMSKALLGLPLDIHGGGPDLKFPHHENEIAQTEGAFGGTLANHWLHCGPLMVDASKMSKSLGNFRTIRQTVNSLDLPQNQADYSANPREAEMLRFFIVRNHYRSIQNYTPDNLADAQHALDRLYQTLQAYPANAATDMSATLAPPSDAATLSVATTTTDHSLGVIDWYSHHAQAFAAAMNDDFNTAGAVAVLFDLAAHANRHGVDGHGAKGVKANVSSTDNHSSNHENMSGAEAVSQLRALGGVLGLLQTDPLLYLKSTTRYTRRALEQSQRALEEQADKANQSANQSAFSNDPSIRENISAPVSLTDEQIEAFVQSRAQAKAVKDFKSADAIRANLLAGGVVLEDKPSGLTHWQRG
jgi:cysteinyl-tRNA synthetase